jgi:hypothetical protein
MGMGRLSFAARVAQRFLERVAVAPPGWEGPVKEMKKNKDIDNPWALAWSMKNKGDTPHKDNEAEASISRPGPEACGPMEAAKTPQNVFDRHQLKILIDTVKNPLKGKFLGGPSAEEAEQTLRDKFQYTDAQIQRLKQA